MTKRCAAALRLAAAAPSATASTSFRSICLSERATGRERMASSAARLRLEFAPACRPLLLHSHLSLQTSKPAASVTSEANFADVYVGHYSHRPKLHADIPLQPIVLTIGCPHQRPRLMCASPAKVGRKNAISDCRDVVTVSSMFSTLWVSMLHITFDPPYTLK